MHWKPTLPLVSGGWEPLELRELKKQLANVHCDCSFCETYKEFTKQQCQRLQELYKNQEVQSEQKADPTKPAVFVVSDQTITEDSYLTSAKPPLFNSNDQMCPSCMFTLNLLRSGTTKILKDEESEAKTEISSSEKASGKIIEYLNKTTSYCKPLLKYPLATVSSVDSAGSQNRSLREVTFAFNDKFYGYDDMNMSSEPTSTTERTDDINYEEEEETGSTSMETESEVEEILRPAQRSTSMGLCANGVDINKLINSIRPIGVPEFYTMKDHKRR